MRSRSDTRSAKGTCPSSTTFSSADAALGFVVGRGNVLATSALRSTSAILRETIGVNIVVQRGLRIKLSGEYWDFSDFDNEIAVHAGVTANF